MFSKKQASKVKLKFVMSLTNLTQKYFSPLLQAFTGSGFRLDGKKKKSNVPSDPVPMGPPVIKRYAFVRRLFFLSLTVNFLLSSALKCLYET